MKNRFLLMALILPISWGWVNSSHGKSFKPLSIPTPGYTVEIPDAVVLPDLSRFELAVPPRPHPNVPHFIMILYRDPSFRYFDEGNGEEIFPYMELLKKEEGVFHLITLAFINPEVQIEVYDDHGGFSGPAMGRLEKVIVKQRPIRKVPR